MAWVWTPAEAGDLAEVQRLVGEDPGLLNARDNRSLTPLMCAASKGRVGVVRWLLGKGAALDLRDRRP
jgi:ankyrin repeat protein